MSIPRPADEEPHHIVAGPDERAMGVVSTEVLRFAAHSGNRLLRRHGHLWQDESFDHVFRRDEQFVRVVEYIRRAPVRARLVARPEDYR